MTGCNTIRAFTYDRCEANLGGIKNVWLANYEENVAEVAPSTSGEGENQILESAITGITLGETNSFVKYPMRKNVASMTSTLNNSTEGASYVTTELAMVFSKMETQKRLAIVALALGEAMAIVEDSNGKFWFLGKDAPLTATAGTGETGTAKGDRNAYTVTLTDESLEFPHEVSKNALETLGIINTGGSTSGGSTSGESTPTE